MPNPFAPTTIGNYILNLFEGRIKHIFYGNNAIESEIIDKSAGKTVIVTRIITRGILQCKHVGHRRNKRRRLIIECA